MDPRDECKGRPGPARFCRAPSRRPEFPQNRSPEENAATPPRVFGRDAGYLRARPTEGIPTWFRPADGWPAPARRTERRLAIGDAGAASPPEIPLERY